MKTKKILSALLAALLLWSLILPATAKEPAGIWDAENEIYTLSDGPEIIRLAADSNENGTRVQAFFRMSDEARLLGDAIHAADGNTDKAYADRLGLDREDVYAWFELSVQVAYSFDGSAWVNDWETDEDPADPTYYAKTEFDRDGDGFSEYREMPSFGVNEKNLEEDATVFDGRAGMFTAWYCSPGDGMTLKQAIDKYNEAVLQGRGEYLGRYDREDDSTNGKGMAVDFNKQTLYVKARYRLYNNVQKRVDGEWGEHVKTVVYSDWSDVKTYSNANRTPEGQDCVPDVSALLTEAKPTLTALSSARRTVERDGIEVKATKYQLALRLPADTEAALVRFLALDGDVRESYTDEYYNPHLIVEMRVGDGGWYSLTDVSVNEPYFDFDDDVYWIRDKMEAQGYEAGDPVFLRVSLWGSYSYTTTAAEDGMGELLVPREPVHIRTGYSNEVELSLTGKWKVNYELNGGSFPYESTPLETFDEETDVTVDLTSPAYTPAQRHYTFRGWFTTADFAPGSGITSFDTTAKVSRTYYAKWEELPHYALTYDLGAITAYVYNPNPESLYPDDGEAADGVIDLQALSYEGADFLGWYDQRTGGNRLTALSYADLTGDTTLYARWELPTFTIAYPGAGTDYVNAPQNPESFQIDPGVGANVKLFAPTKTGYVFDGWFFKPDLTDALRFDKGENAWIMDRGENVTVYAKFIVGRWAVNYVHGVEGVWNGNNPETHTYGQAVTLADPTRTGYTFGGWFTDEARTQKITEIPAEYVGEITLYAKWTAITYKIVYDLRDPDAANFLSNTNPTSRLADDEITLLPLSPVGLRYKFLGWYDNVNLDGDPVTVIRAGTDRDVTLYAGLYRYVWGDVDFDGRVTASDARLVLRQAVGLEDLPADALAWGDVSEPDPSHALTAADARSVLRMAVGLDDVNTLGLPEAPSCEF